MHYFIVFKVLNPEGGRGETGGRGQRIGKIQIFGNYIDDEDWIFAV